MGEAPPRNLRIDVSDILDNLADSVDAELDVALEPLVVGSEGFEPLSPAHVSATLTYAGTAIVATGTTDVEVQAVCSRCLREFPFRVSGSIEGFYVRHGSEDELPEDQEFEFIEERAVDLLPAIRSALVLELPFAPVHAEDCPGICPVCGKDLSDGPCGCEPDVSDSPFARLKELLGPDADDR